MDRRGFLRTSSIVLRPQLPFGGGFVSSVLGGQTTVTVTPILQGYGELMRTIIGNFNLNTWPHTPQPNTLKLGLPLLGQVAKKIGNLIEGNSSNSLFESIFSVDKYIGTQIFCTHFSSFTKEQRSQAMEHLFFTAKIDSDGDYIDENLSNDFLGNDEFTRTHHSLTDYTAFVANWFHSLGESDVLNFIEALPEYGGHFHDWTTMNLFYTIFDIDSFHDKFSGVQRLILLYENIKHQKWRKIFLDCMLDTYKYIQLTPEQISNLGNPSLMRHVVDAERIISENLESIGGIITVDNISEFNNLKAQSIGTVVSGGTIGVESVGMRSGLSDAIGTIPSILVTGSGGVENPASVEESISYPETPFLSDKGLEQS